MADTAVTVRQRELRNVWRRKRYAFGKRMIDIVVSALLLLLLLPLLALVAVCRSYVVKRVTRVFFPPLRQPIACTLPVKARSALRP